MYDENNDEDNNQVEQLASRMPTSQQWEMAARNIQMAKQQAFLNTLKNEQSAVHNDLRTMKQAVNQRLAQQTLRMQYASASLMKEANGGACTPQDIQWWNSQTGAGGKNKGVVLQKAGYDDNGNFNMVFVDPTTKAESVFTASQLDQYQMANNMPGIFSDQDRIGMHNALLSSGHSDQELSKYSSQLNVVGGANITHNRPVSANVNLTTGEISGFGGRPGPRPRYWSEDDFNGTPYKDENAPGRRYLGHGISSFSTADWQEDREEKRNPNGRWVETAVGPSDDFVGAQDETYTDENGVAKTRHVAGNNSQVRTYKNTKTGEVVRVKDGETPPWRRNDAVEIARAKQRNGSGWSVDGQMAIDDNRAKNAKQAQWDKRDFTLRKLYLDRVVKDEKAIDEYAKNRKKPRKGRHGEVELTEEELAKAEEDIAAYRKRREEARAKDFDGVDIVQNGDGDAGSAVAQRQGGSGAQGKSTTKRKKVKGEVSKYEYDQKLGSGYYEGHIHYDNSGPHYVIDGKKMLDGSSFSLEEADDFDRLMDKYNFKFTGKADPNDKEMREIYENLKRREARETGSGGQATGKKEDNGGGKADGVTITKAQLKRAEAQRAEGPRDRVEMPDVSPGIIDYKAIVDNALAEAQSVQKAKQKAKENRARLRRDTIDRIANAGIKEGAFVSFVSKDGRKENRYYEGLDDEGRPKFSNTNSRTDPLTSKFVLDLDEYDDLAGKGIVNKKVGKRMEPTEYAKRSYEQTTGAEALENPILAQIANMGTMVGGRLNAKAQLKRAEGENLKRREARETGSGGQATGKKKDNGGGKADVVTITKAQLKRAEGRGAHYDEKTGELVTKDGRRLKVTIQ